MQTPIASFRDHWTHLRELTFAFVEAVPDSHWLWSPHPRFAPFAKQVRHVICVQGVYQEGLAGRRVDFGRKHEHYSGSLERDALLAGLRARDAELEACLRAVNPEARVEFFGRQLGLDRYLATIAQHEAIHHGEWSFYAALGGFETPRLWKIQWGL
jgi:hypothetical protein